MGYLKKRTKYSPDWKDRILDLRPDKWNEACLSNIDKLHRGSSFLVEVLRFVSRPKHHSIDILSPQNSTSNPLITKSSKNQKLMITLLGTGLIRSCSITSVSLLNEIPIKRILNCFVQFLQGTQSSRFRNGAAVRYRMLDQPHELFLKSQGNARFQ